MSWQQSEVRKQCSPVYRSLGIREPYNHNKMSSVAEHALRGSALASFVEEPTHYVADLLEGHPDAQSVSNVLSLYKAYVVQLAELADNMTPTEMAWKRDIPIERVEKAREKFEELENGGERISNVLDSYREAVGRLERTMKRLAAEGQSFGAAQVINPMAGRSTEPTDFGIMKMMSTGLDKLFVQESFDSCELDVIESQPGTSTQCYSESETEWSGTRENKLWGRVTCSSHSSSSAELVYPSLSPPHTSGTCLVAATKRTTERQIVSRYPSPQSPQQLTYGHSHHPQHSSAATPSYSPSRYPDSPSGRQGLIKYLSKEVEHVVDSFTPSLPADTAKSVGAQTRHSTGMAADVTHYSFETPESEVSSKISTTDFNTEIQRVRDESTNLVTNCPTCRQLSVAKATLEKQLCEARKRMKEKSAEVDRLQPSLSLTSENQRLQNKLYQVQNEISQLLFDNSKLNSKIEELSLEKAKLQENVIREDNPGLMRRLDELDEENGLLKDTISSLQRKNVSQGEKQSLQIKEKDVEINHLSAKIESLKNEIQKLKASNNADLQTLAAEEKKLYEKENERLRRLSVELQEEIDLLKESLRKESVEPEFLRQKTQKLKELEEEVEHLRKLKAEFDSGNERAELKEAEIKKLKNELRLAKQDIELYHKGLGPNSKTAYIVRIRDQQITKLQENLAELERIIAQLTQRSPHVSPKRKGKSQHNDLPLAPKQENESEMLLLMAEDTSRLKLRLRQLEEDNSTLVRKIQERDAKMYEMQTEIDWLVKGTNQQELITNYTQKLRSGEEEMGKLHQKMEVITQRHSTLLLAKENEILEVRTHYAKQLSQLINECVSRNESQESEMKNLCNELDNLEKRNFELERLVKEYEKTKTEQIPKLRKDLDALRLSKNELRSEFEQTNRHMKELQRDLQIAQKEKLDLEKLHESNVAKLRSELENTKRDLCLKEDKHKSALSHKDTELKRLKLELNNVSATVQERDGSVTHWKIKCEDINRQVRDLEERHAIAIKAKDTEIKSLNGQIGELVKSVDSASAINEKELFQVQSQFRELQRQHLDILEQNDSNVKLKEDEMKRLYSEIGEISANLHSATKEKDQEIHRLRNDLKRQRDEKDSFLVECSNTIQEKQAEIRKLMADIEQLEVEAARFHALKEQELAGVKSEYQFKMDQHSSDRAHLLAIKDSEIQTLSTEIERLMNDAKDGGYSIVEMKKRIFQLEQDKNELLLLKVQWQADMDKLFSEFEQCKEDKHEFEEMVERISREMEERIEGMKSDQKNALEIKDNHIRDLYGKVEKIAKDRGDMSAHLHRVLQEKEQKIEELFAKLKEYDKCLDQAEKDFRNKLQRKSQEVKWLRGEIRKMGDEGVRLLDMREREITEMRTHLKNILRVMEHKQKQKASSHLIITRPQFIQPVEPHLKAADTPQKAAPKKKRTASNRRLRR